MYMRCIFSVCTVILAGELPYAWSFMVYMHGFGQPCDVSLVVDAHRYDKSICVYEFDKLDKPKEAMQRIRKCHTAAIVSMAYDHSNNCILTGAIDGSMKVWSMEGRCVTCVLGGG